MLRNTLIATFALTLVKIVSGESSNYLKVPDGDAVRVYQDATHTFRLPNNTRPETYQINLRSRIHEGNFTFEGNVAITILITETSTSIVLHHRQLMIHNLELRSLDGGAIVPTNFEYDPIYEFLIVNVAVGQLSAESRYILEIDYSGVLRTAQAGFYRSSYLNATGDRVWLAATQFEPIDARHGFPCFDEPALKATFSISITHDSSYSAVSNMPVSSQDVNYRLKFSFEQFGCSGSNKFFGEPSRISNNPTRLFQVSVYVESWYCSPCLKQKSAHDPGLCGSLREEFL